MTPQPPVDLGNVAQLDPVRQEVRLTRRIRGDMVRNSPFQLRRLARAAIPVNRLGRATDLTALAPMTLHDVTRISDLLAYPAVKWDRHHGPIAWSTDTTVPLGYSATDLKTLAKIGVDMFRSWGIGKGDVVINLLPVWQFRDHHQISMGARQRGITHIATDDAETTLLLDASVLVGGADDLLRTLEAGYSSPRLHTIVLVGHIPLPAQVAALQAASESLGAQIVRMFAPEGALAAWASCRGGNGVVLHTWPDHELIELVDAISGLPTTEMTDPAHGAVLWTGTGWRCMSMLRVQLPLFAGMENGACPHCGKRSPRIYEVDEVTSFYDLLDRTEGLVLWAAELQGLVDGDQLWIWVVLEDESQAVDVLARLGDQLGESVRIELASENSVRTRIENAKGERFGDRRAFAAD